MSDDWKEVVVEWRGDTGFVGKNKTGGMIQIGSIANQPGVSPMELLLLGVAGCTGVDIVSILKKQRQNLSDFQVQVRGKRADTHPKVYTDIEVIYHLWGDNIDVNSVERAIHLSEEKYCSASVMLRASANIRSQYFIHAPGDKSPLSG
jgi:putative redox protein